VQIPFASPQFFAAHPDGFLAYPYDAYAPCPPPPPPARPPDEEEEAGVGLGCPPGGDSEVDPAAAADPAALSVFRRPGPLSPSERGWARFESNFLPERRRITASGGGGGGAVSGALRLVEVFWDGPVFAGSMAVVEALNGVDEV
jgi:hypothetical protein